MLQCYGIAAIVTANCERYKLTLPRVIVHILRCYGGVCVCACLVCVPSLPSSFPVVGESLSSDIPYMYPSWPVIYHDRGDCTSAGTNCKKFPLNYQGWNYVDGMSLSMSAITNAFPPSGASDEKFIILDAVTRWKVQCSNSSYTGSPHTLTAILRFGVQL